MYQKRGGGRILVRTAQAQFEDLDAAVVRRDVKKVKALLKDAHFDPNCLKLCDGLKETLLEKTCRAGLGEIATLLISAKINVSGSREAEALLLAASWGRIQILNIMLEHKADVNTTHPVSLMTSLMLSAQNGLNATCEWLLNAKAEVNYTSPNNKTALQIAWRQFDLKTLGLLVQWGAIVSPEDWINSLESVNLCRTLASGFSEWKRNHAQAIREGRAEDVAHARVPNEAVLQWIVHAPLAASVLLSEVLLQRADSAPQRADIGNKDFLVTISSTTQYDKSRPELDDLCPEDKGQATTVAVEFLEVVNPLRCELLYAISKSSSPKIFSSLGVRGIIRLAWNNYVRRVFIRDVGIETVLLITMVIWVNVLSTRNFLTYCFRWVSLILLAIITLREIYTFFCVLSYKAKVGEALLTSRAKQTTKINQRKSDDDKDEKKDEGAGNATSAKLVADVGEEKKTKKINNTFWMFRLRTYKHVSLFDVVNLTSSFVLLINAGTVSGQEERVLDIPPYLIFLSITSFIRWIRLLGFICAFRSIGPSVIPIIRSLSAILAFLFVFVIFVFAFAHSVYIFNYKDVEHFPNFLEFLVRHVFLGMVTRWPCFMEQVCNQHHSNFFREKQKKRFDDYGYIPVRSAINLWNNNDPQNWYCRDPGQFYEWQMAWYCVMAFVVSIILLQVFVGVLSGAYRAQMQLAHNSFLQNLACIVSNNFINRSIKPITEEMIKEQKKLWAKKTLARKILSLIGKFIGFCILQVRRVMGMITLPNDGQYLWICRPLDQVSSNSNNQQAADKVWSKFLEDSVNMVRDSCKQEADIHKRFSDSSDGLEGRVEHLYEECVHMSPVNFFEQISFNRNMKEMLQYNTREQTGPVVRRSAISLDDARNMKNLLTVPGSAQTQKAMAPGGQRVLTRRSFGSLFVPTTQREESQFRQELLKLQDQYKGGNASTKLSRRNFDHHSSSDESESGSDSDSESVNSSQSDKSSMLSMTSSRHRSQSGGEFKVFEYVNKKQNNQNNHQNVGKSSARKNGNGSAQNSARKNGHKDKNSARNITKDSRYSESPSTDRNRI